MISYTLTLKSQNGSRFSIVSAPIYEHHETGDAPVYYRSKCSVSVPVTDLGEGTHSFQAYIYPNVTGGEHLVRAITPDTIVNLSRYFHWFALSDRLLFKAIYNFRKHFSKRHFWALDRTSGLSVI